MESQIIKSLKEYESRLSVNEICRELGIAKGTFNNWRKKYSEMEASQRKEPKLIRLKMLD